jgi:NAD(P)-dependent dehydrogenase (short-subunit alcohol dehydrogenase family)
MRLKDKVMVVTGGGSGIGQAAALRCAQAGAKIVVMDIAEEGGLETERMLQGQGEGHLFIQGDVTKITEGEWDSLLNLNLKETFLGAKHAIPLMLKGNWGSIVNHASTLGLIRLPNMPAYSASKGGVFSFTRQLAPDYAKQSIRVNCICPGPTLTPRPRRYVEQGLTPPKRLLKDVPIGRFAQPEKIAAAVLFLASDEASFITGAALVIDGAQTAD